MAALSVLLPAADRTTRKRGFPGGVEIAFAGQRTGNHIIGFELLIKLRIVVTDGFGQLAGGGKLLLIDKHLCAP